MKIKYKSIKLNHKNEIIDYKTKCKDIQSTKFSVKY